MFRLKVIFFVAALSVVNAAITVNIYDDDGKDVTTVKEDYQEVHGCINQVCDELCRLLKFPGGACDNGRCICNNMKPTDGKRTDVEKTLHLERSLQEARSCYNQACDQLCRRLKFPGGACIHGRCKCDNFKQAELVIENVKDLGSCNWRAYDQLCRRLGFSGGVCFGDNCKYEDLLKVNDLSANKCNNVECETYCQKLGLPDIQDSGYCYQDRCICYKKNVIDEAKTFQRCDVVACNYMCNRMNYIGGMCRNGFCYCF